MKLLQTEHQSLFGDYDSKKLKDAFIHELEDHWDDILEGLKEGKTLKFKLTDMSMFDLSWFTK